jgi:polar amino acid transport system substrate-binding protein
MCSIRSGAVGILLAAIAVGASAQSLPASAQSLPAATRAELAPTGTLRAGINYNNPLLAKRDAATGELGGIAVDLSRELAKRVGVPLELIPYDAAGKISDAAKSGAWDIAYLAIDPARATDIDYSAAYIQLEGTYLVPPGSPLQKVEDVDREGVRIAVTTKSAYDLYLSRELKHAQIVHAETTPISIDMMMAQKLDAVAAVRTALLSGAKRVPGARVMDGHFMTIPQAAAVPKGRPAAARLVRDFIEEMKAAGFVAAALQRHGLGPDDAVVAPPAVAPPTVAPPAAAVHVVTYLDVRPASANAGASLAAQYQNDTKTAAGMVAVNALREPGRPNRFVIIETWRDQAAFAEHERAPHTLAFRESFRAIRRSPYDQRVTHGFAVDPVPATAGRNALYVVTHVDVPGARREEAEVLLRRLFESSRTKPGHVRYDIYQQNEPRTNHFTIFAVWDDERAFDATGSAPHWQQFTEALAPMLGALYDERLYRPIKPKGLR